MRKTTRASMSGSRWGMCGRAGALGSVLVLAFACASQAPVRELTFGSTFPHDAVTVCFVRQPGNDELACTATRLRVGDDGAFVVDGEELHVVGRSPSERIALARVLVRASDAKLDGKVGGESDREFRVRAVAYNAAGASLLSRDYFVVDLDGGVRPVRVVRTRAGSWSTGMARQP